MRISDWSSDVCSSDLSSQRLGRARRKASEWSPIERDHRAECADPRSRARIMRGARRLPAGDADGARRQGRTHYVPARPARSEEYTSDLQSLMRISYAVFRWNKTKRTSHYSPFTHTPPSTHKTPIN